MIEFLAMLDRIRPLSDPLRERLSGIMTERKVRRNEFLVKAGVVNSHVFFIKEGIVRCYYLKESQAYRPNREVSLCFFMENDIIASTWSFAQQKPGREYMVALEDCSIGMIHFAELEKTYALFPELNLHGRVLTQKYSTLWYTLLGGLRTQTAKERYDFLLNNSPVLHQRVPAKYLASYLGINAVTLSRIKRATPSYKPPRPS
jgi:CRP/FNR family transcriptional regulator, anaerobic regulatory protein